MLPAYFRGALPALLISVAVATAHASGQGVIRGAEMVNVRRGPSPDSAAVVLIRKGTVVTVERVVDGWARIRLASGQEGYVNAALVQLPAGAHVASLQTPTPEGIASFTPEAMPTETPAGLAPGTPPAHAGPHDGLESELAQLRSRLAALESAVVATPGGASRPEGSQAGTDATPNDGEATHAAGALLPTPSQPLEPEDIGPSLALAGVGLLIGFLLGAAYGQRQERNRRSRVRF